MSKRLLQEHCDTDGCSRVNANTNSQSNGRFHRSRPHSRARYRRGESPPRSVFGYHRASMDARTKASVFTKHYH